MTEQTEQQAKLKAKLNEMKLKRGGKIPQDANVQGAASEPPTKPSDEQVSKTIQKIVALIKEINMFPDQIYHLGAELQLVATNDMIMNGMNNFGVNIEKYMQEKFISVEDIQKANNRINNIESEAFIHEKEMKQYVEEQGYIKKEEAMTIIKEFNEKCKLEPEPK